MRAIADEVGAYAVMDAAHIAGMIAGGVLRNPFDDGFDIVTTTTHKSLRGPRGGMILIRDKKALGRKIDKSVFPGFQGGPIMQMIAAKAVAFEEALLPEFKEYSKQIIANAKTMADECLTRGARLVTGGTDNHLLMLDAVTTWGITGQEAETLFDDIGITLNKNMIADDPRPPMDPSGIRFGTPAVTTRGMKEDDMRTLIDFMFRAVEVREDEAVVKAIHQEVIAFCLQFPLPGIDV
jgi:glycine hydroxymethyltransferase